MKRLAIMLALARAARRLRRLRPDRGRRGRRRDGEQPPVAPVLAAVDRRDGAGPVREARRRACKSIVGSEGGGTTVRNVVSGGLPIGEVATTAAVTAFMAGADIRIVGGGVASSKDVFWVTGPDSELDSIEDLAGKEVGYTSPGSVTQGLLALSLERSGVGVDNVKTRSMGGLTEGLTALKNGDIDAAAILEPMFSEQVEEEGWKPVFRPPTTCRSSSPP